MFKRADELHTPDPYFSGAAGFVGSGLEQLHDDMSRMELPQGVPDSVRRCHDALRHTYIYSYYSYDLLPVAAAQTFPCLELALRERLGSQFVGKLDRKGKTRPPPILDELTRLDFAIGSAGLMRWALNLTLHHTHGRRTFQRVLAEQPLMRNVLADLCLESEAATVIAFRLARAIDEAAAGSEQARLLERILTPVAKFWNCKRVPGFVAECVECHGGNGFIEEQPMARLYREAPLNGIWEGTGNVICLDVLRALQCEPDSVAALLDELSLARGADHRLDTAIDALEVELSDVDAQEHRARHITAMIATVVEGALLVRHSAPAVADAYVASRLDGMPNRAFGSLPRGIDATAIVARAVVQ